MKLFRGRAQASLILNVVFLCVAGRDCHSSELHNDEKVSFLQPGEEGEDPLSGGLALQVCVVGLQVKLNCPYYCLSGYVN